jgi:hypothetical protein
MDVNMATGQTRRTDWKNNSMNVSKRVAESWICCVRSLTRHLGLCWRNESNEDVVTYVELQRGGREMAVV